MPLYMTQFAYTTEAWAALLDSPEDRSAPCARWSRPWAAD